jgi:hypothetical protein
LLRRRTLHLAILVRQTHSCPRAFLAIGCDISLIQTHNPATNQLTVLAVITDPSDPKFDLEKLLLKVQKESP